MPEPFKLLRDQLWEIKNSNGGLTFKAMADQAGLPETTIWRVMKGQRQPAAPTLGAILAAWPELGAIFLPPDSPDGKDASVELSECATTEPAT